MTVHNLSSKCDKDLNSFIFFYKKYEGGVKYKLKKVSQLNLNLYFYK